MNKKISVIIPARNEAQCLPEVLKEMPMDIIHEVIVVDGHSTDGTPEIVRSLGHRLIPQVGMGYGDAIDLGIASAEAKYVTIMDADGSYDPKNLYQLLNRIESTGEDIIFSSRYLPESGSDDDTVIRFIGNKLFTFLLRLIHGVNITDSLFIYIMADKEIFKKFKMHSRHYEWCIELPIRIKQAGLTYSEVPSRERPRLYGDSQVNAFIDGLKILWTLIKYRFVK